MPPFFSDISSAHLKKIRRALLFFFPPPSSFGRRTMDFLHTEAEASLHFSPTMWDAALSRKKSFREKGIFETVSRMQEVFSKSAFPANWAESDCKEWGVLRTSLRQISITGSISLYIWLCFHAADFAAAVVKRAACSTIVSPPSPSSFLSSSLPHENEDGLIDKQKTEEGEREEGGEGEKPRGHSDRQRTAPIPPPPPPPPARGRTDKKKRKSVTGL